MPWNPDRYHRFRDQRFAPFEDLLPWIDVRPGLSVVDLGCGTGELTARLAQHLPHSRVLGIDSSAEMLERTESLELPNLDFAVGRIESLSGEWDLVFSHAAIHWVEDHRWLIPFLWERIAPGGQLAVQQPSNHGHPAQLAVLETAAQAPFVEALNGWTRRSPVMTVDAYAQMLFDLGGEDIRVAERVYPHVLENADAVAAWTRGTVLVPYLERLNPDVGEAFFESYARSLRRLWPGEPVFYGFRRTFFSARKPA